jgi:hypothetical protein
MRNFAKMVREQEKWMEEHGGSQAGYVARYGSKDDADHYGDGGEAIWEADRVELLKLRSLMHSWPGK